MLLKRKLVLVTLLYFAEGFPFGLIEQTLPVYFRIHGMSLMDIGLLGILNIPYAVKFLWAPAVDFFGSRRRWIVAAQFCLSAGIILMLPFDPSSPGMLLWVIIFSLAVFSATQDIAIDAYTIELLNTSEMGIANGFRQASYRTAMVISGGLFVALGGKIGWQTTFIAASIVLFICAIVSLYLPSIETKHPTFSMKSLMNPIRDFLARPGVIQVALFILLYKLGDMAMGPMVRPFWLAAGLSTTEIGLITGTFGAISSIAGGLAGGLFMAKYGIFHGLWFLGLWQSVSNLSYAYAAAFPDLGNIVVYAAAIIESFCGGLGTSAFLAFLMSICSKEYSATQYAVLSALFRITGIFAAVFSGLAAEAMGYAQYFTLTFFVGLPAFLFLFHAKAWIPVNSHN